MKPKLKRVIAVIALVFIGLFTVSLVAFFANKSLFNGALGYFAIGSGAVGLALFFVIKLSREYPEEESELKKILDADEDNAPQTDNAATEEKSDETKKTDETKKSDETEKTDEKS